MSKRMRYPTHRDYPRVARLNELFRQIIGEELEKIDDEDLELVTVTGVRSDPDMYQAVVFFSALTVGVDHHDDTIATLNGHRVRLQKALGRQARIKRVPILRFEPDPAIESGARVDAILQSIDEERITADADHITEEEE